MVERIKSRKGVGQKPKYLLFLEALNRIYRTLQSDSVTVIKIVIKADYLGFLISYNGLYWRRSGLLPLKLIRINNVDVTTNVHKKQ